jgi:dodecin
MAKVVKVIELMSESPKSWEDAASNAVGEASRRLRNIRSVYVKDMTASVEDGRVTSYRLNSKVTLESWKASVMAAGKSKSESDGWLALH